MQMQNSVIADTNYCNDLYSSLLGHKNIFGYRDMSTVNLVPIVQDPTLLSYSLLANDPQPSKEGEYTLNPLFRSWSGKEWERMVGNIQVRSTRFQKHGGMRRWEVLQSFVEKYPAKRLADISFCRWVIEESSKSPQSVQKYLPTRICSGDAWFYLPGTLVRSTSGGWHVLALRRNYFSGFSPEVMYLNSFWNKEHEIILLGDY